MKLLGISHSFSKNNSFNCSLTTGGLNFRIRFLPRASLFSSDTMCYFSSCTHRNVWNVLKVSALERRRCCLLYFNHSLLCSCYGFSWSKVHSRWMRDFSLHSRWMRDFSLQLYRQLIKEKPSGQRRVNNCCLYILFSDDTLWIVPEIFLWSLSVREKIRQKSNT